MTPIFFPQWGGLASFAGSGAVVVLALALFACWPVLVLKLLDRVGWGATDQVQVSNPANGCKSYYVDEELEQVVETPLDDKARAPPCPHAILAAAAPHDPGFQTGILPGSPGYALYRATCVDG